MDVFPVKWSNKGLVQLLENVVHHLVANVLNAPDFLNLFFGCVVFGK